MLFRKLSPLVVFAILSTCVSAEDFKLQAIDGTQWYRGNTHSHSTESDGKLPMAERFGAYQEAGYDFLVLTDHRKVNDVSAYSDDGVAFAEELLEACHVAVTPGIDFGSHGTTHYLRFSYTREIEHMREGVERLKGYMAERKDASVS